MKALPGRGLYVTLSKFLVENSRRIYFSNSYEAAHQEMDFLSLKELIQTVEIPKGKELRYNDFLFWWNRNKIQSEIKDPHKIYEEFQGVITGSTYHQGFLSRSEYNELGVRQSIFRKGERDSVYDLFEKFQCHCRVQNLFDLNQESFRLLNRVEAQYDFIVIDEIQDLTNIQIQFVLKNLLKTGEWIFCGDSNQIVHPNFFSWSKVKTFCFHTETDSPREIIQILNNNFRNSVAVTDLANRLLVLKNKKFGSIDKESNYLVASKSSKNGKILAVRSQIKNFEEIDKRTKKSTRFAILVPTEEHKIKAKTLFQTPLIFTIHESKGLEYKNVVLFEFFSTYKKEFEFISEGIEQWDHVITDLQYLRAKDKTDKSLDVYKFFINSLYVGMTRSMENLIILDSISGQTIQSLLCLPSFEEQIQLDTEDESSMEEWREEAQRLEKQGKLEQALDIHKMILGDKKAVPWPVMNEDLRTQYSFKMIQQSLSKIDKSDRAFLWDYAVQEGLSKWVDILLQGRPKGDFLEDHTKNKNKYYLEFLGKNYKNLEKKISEYGIDFKNPMDQTPLHVSAQWGVFPLMKELLRQGANTRSEDSFGRNPLSFAFFCALSQHPRLISRADYIANIFPQIFELLSEEPLSFQSQQRLVKIHRRAFEYFLFYFIYNYYLVKVLSGLSLSEEDFIFDSSILNKLILEFPESVIPAHRRKRSYCSMILSKNEIHSSNPYNRGLFVRVGHGKYVFNPQIFLEKGEDEWRGWEEMMSLTLLSDVLNMPSAKTLKKMCLHILSFFEKATPHVHPSKPSDNIVDSKLDF